MSSAVFVSGASGYIGRNVAHAFRREGWTVYGLVRSAEKAEKALLPQNEVIPIVGDASNPSTFSCILSKCDVVVETAPVGSVPATLQATIDSGAASDGSKKVFIFTAGFKQYDFEEAVLNEDRVITCVVRPSFVFGGSGGYAFEKIYFKTPEEGKPIVIDGKPDKTWPWIHVFDLAKGYIAIVNNKYKVGGKLFRFGRLEGAPTHEEIIRACGKAMGFAKEENYTYSTEAIEGRPDFSVPSFDNEESASTLGLAPTFAVDDFVKNAEIYYESFKSWHS